MSTSSTAALSVRAAQGAAVLTRKQQGGRVQLAFHRDKRAGEILLFSSFSRDNFISEVISQNGPSWSC